MQTGIEGGQYWPFDTNVSAQHQKKVEDWLAETKQVFYFDYYVAWPVLSVL